MVYAYFIRSPYAHAKIKIVDVSKARQLEGVLDVVSGAVIKDKVAPIPCAWQIPGSDLNISRYMSLAVDRVRYVGDPVAVVVAESYEAAQDAAHLVNVEYDVLPCVVNPEEAVKQNAPQLYDDIPYNKVFTWKASGGEVENAFS
ncbi:MAG: hypothetical protein QXH32_10415, partial [Candidatus Caldarchaeum sp.]